MSTRAPSDVASPRLSAPPGPRGVNHPTNSEQGFTLVEILVAFTVAVLLLGAVYRVFSAGLRAEGSAEAYGKAVLIAQSSLDTLWVGPVAEGDVSDSVGAYARHVSVKRRGDLGRDDVRRPMAPYEITVDVGWRDGGRQRQVSLSAIRLGPP